MGWWLLSSTDTDVIWASPKLLDPSKFTTKLESIVAPVVE